MRNTTKLKHILLQYSVCIDMDEDGLFTFTLVDKFKNNSMFSFEAKSYSAGIAKAYSHLIKSTKNPV